MTFGDDDIDDVIAAPVGDGFGDALDDPGTPVGPAQVAPSTVAPDGEDSFDEEPAPHWGLDASFTDELVAISADDWQVDADDIWDIGVAVPADDVELPGI